VNLQRGTFVRGFSHTKEKSPVPSVPRNDLLAKPEVQEAIKKMIDVARSALPDASFAVQEETLVAMLEEVDRATLEARLVEISASFADEILVDGVQYKRHQPGVGLYHCLSGRLQVQRDTYRQVGVRNGATIVPLELAAGLVEGATPALGFSIADGYACHDMRQHGSLLEGARRVPPPRATLERMAKRIAASAVDAAPRIEAYLRSANELPEGVHGVAIGLDRTSVPMAELRPEGAPPKPAPKRTKPRVRVAPPPIDVNYRMGYVGTVSFVDAQGNALATCRYAAPACDDPSLLVKSMAADVRAACRRHPGLHVGVVQDGAPEMWSLTRAGLQGLVDDGVIDHWEEGIDRYHLLERLGEALDLVGLTEKEKAEHLASWKERLDAQDSAIDSIERELLRWYNELDEAQAERLWEHLVYLRNNKDRMRYVSLTVAGLPIGSGVTESAAKTVVGLRTNASGQRWSVPGLRGVLRLRGLQQSDRMPAFWSYFSRRYVRKIEAA
jgi:hypothetical protein